MSIKELYGIVVFNCGIEPNYFLDHMTIFEVDAVIHQYNKTYQNGWEQTRFIAYITALSSGQKLKSPREILTFSWEEDTTEIKEKPSREQISEMVNNFTESLTKAQQGLGEQMKF